MGQKDAIALNEKNSNEEPTDGVRPMHIVLSKTRVPRICACIWYTLLNRISRSLIAGFVDR